MTPRLLESLGANGSIQFDVITAVLAVAMALLATRVVRAEHQVAPA